MCVVTNNSSYTNVKNYNTADHVFGKYWMQARGILNYLLRYCWPKVIYSICQQNQLKQKITKKKKPGVPNRGPAKNLGCHSPPSPPLESPLVWRINAVKIWWACWCSTGVPNLGYMYPQGYICLSEGLHLRLAIEDKIYLRIFYFLIYIHTSTS